MGTSPSLSRYLEEAKIEELRDIWAAKGYNISRAESFADNLTADFVARRGEETIIIEVKTATSLVQARETVRQLARWAAEKPNTSFHLVIANPPRHKSIEIEGLDDTLSNYLINKKLPSELDELSTHTLVESINDIEIQDIQIQPGEIRALGSGIVQVRLQYGSDGDLRGDEGLATYDAFPFKFDLTLDANLKPLEINHLEIDTSSFYE